MPTKHATGPKPRFLTGDWVAWGSATAPLVVRVIGYAGQGGKGREHFYELREPVIFGKTVDYQMPERSLRPATPEEIAATTGPDYPVVTLDKYE